MPTGYTAGILEGMTFEQFVLGCARNFGALYSMRDEPAAAPIPDEFTPSDYHDKQLVEDQAELNRVTALSHDECEAEAEAHYLGKMERHEAHLARTEEERAKYEEMLYQVKVWDPPSPEHQNLKDFMVSQIEQSINFDCSEWDPPVRLTGEAWRAERIKSLAWSIEYHADHGQKERESVASRTQWVRQLKESLASIDKATR